MLKKIVLAAIMALSLSTTAFAQGNQGVDDSSAVVSGQEMSAASIVEDLYKNEKSDTVKSLANDLLLVLTGEKEPAHVYSSGLIEIGTYPRDYNGIILDTVGLIGDRLMTTHTDTTFTVFLSRDVQLTPEYFHQCKSELQMIYGKVLEVRTATAGMDQKQTVRYIAQHIADSLIYERHTRGNLADAIATGYATCEPYSTYFYLLATGCGIDASCKTNYGNSNADHAWNAICIDGQESFVDVSSGDSNNMMDAFLFIPKDQYAYTEQRDIWVNQLGD